MKTNPEIKPNPRFLIGLAGALVGICDLYLIYIEAMYACPLTFNLGMAFVITIGTLGIPVLVAGTIGAQAALRSPGKVRLALASASRAGSLERAEPDRSARDLIAPRIAWKPTTSLMLLAVVTPLERTTAFARRRTWRRG